MTAKVGPDALLTPESSVLLLIDHQPCRTQETTSFQQP